MSFWFSARALNSPYTIRRPPVAVASRKPGSKPDTVTVANFEIKRRRPKPYVAVVDEASKYIADSLGLKIGREIFPNRLPQRQADGSNHSLLVDSAITPAPRSYIGAPASIEFARVQLIGVSHDENHFRHAEKLVSSAYELLVGTFNREIG